MVDQKEGRVGVSGGASEYDAPLLAPAVTRDVLAVFGEPVYGEQTYSDEDRVAYTIESRDTDASPGEIHVSLKERGGEEPELVVDGTPAVGSGISITVRGPVSDWALAQTVDDHNLLTELVFQGEPVLSVYGPPARLRASDIRVEGVSGRELLIPEEHRR